MIIDSYDTSEPILKLEYFYGTKKKILEKCLVILSQEIFEYIEKNYDLEMIGRIGGSSYMVPVYKFKYNDEEIGVYLSPMGSVLCGGDIIESSYLTGATKYIMCGSCGTLDNELTQGKFIIPTEAYRDEGLSYHYAPPNDFIKIKNSGFVEKIFKELNIPYIKGKVWTTDAPLMETKNKVLKRKEAGCIGVEMELASCQAVADYYGLELYDFLQPGDVLLDDKYDYSLLKHANHDLLKLDIALKIIDKLNEN